MKYWQFMDYCTDDNPSRNLIRQWFDAQDEGAQAAFMNVLNFLEGQRNWNGLWEIHPLEREHDGLWELRFNATTTKRQRGPFWRYKPVGCMGHQGGQFVFLYGCKKWMETYSPLECFDLGLEMKQKLDSGRGTICEHSF